MQAVIQTAFGAAGDVLTLQNIDTPVCASTGVLVRVAAVGVAMGNWLMTRGLPYIARLAYGIRVPKQRVAGFEFAGFVTEVGAGVSAFSAGDPVFGSHTGALAEYVAVPVNAIARKPSPVTMAQAAATPISGLAALQAVRDSARVQPGQRVLVIGASGGVGSFAVQMAKAFGAHVTGVASSRNQALVRSLGADDVIDYTHEDLDARGMRYDAVIDIAGNRPVSRLRRALTDRGTLVIVGGSGGSWTMGFERTIGAMMLSPFVRHKLLGLISTPNQRDLAVLAELMEAGTVTPVVSATYPLDRAAEAITRVGAGRGHGTTVVLVGAEAQVVS
jgi:NADPH:quinone reductase-like Zn-dependent oxidoreductase